MKALPPSAPLVCSDPSLRVHCLSLKPLDSFWQRARGLLGREHWLDQWDGVALQSCSSIHTWGMRRSIDVLYLNHEHRVIGLHERLGPSRFSLACRQDAVVVVEIAAGFIGTYGIRMGDQIKY
jgi:uncharacterized protein